MQELAKYFLAARDEGQMQKLLQGLLTPNEVSEMRKRLQIFTLLKEGVSQREISKQLGVGIATVTRGSRALKELEEN
ncbi:Trp family transcriptional regulator [Marinomonas algicola]|jgi:TrpR family transcriptional regulator, trp operon repressor|uniref:Trp family transcriptional regulator n=1 Tax=Marinomonas algicola TaxID=2773454 RepID=UPI00174A67FB|nr:Trp family transcriptional regulator [Marinomonas algicola]